MTSLTVEAVEIDFAISSGMVQQDQVSKRIKTTINTDHLVAIHFVNFKNLYFAHVLLTTGGFPIASVSEYPEVILHKLDAERNRLNTELESHLGYKKRKRSWSTTPESPISQEAVAELFNHLRSRLGLLPIEHTKFNSYSEGGTVKSTSNYLVNPNAIVTIEKHDNATVYTLRNQDRLFQIHA